jgi:type 1 glutamine amidotransferase
VPRAATNPNSYKIESGSLMTRRSLVQALLAAPLAGPLTAADKPLRVTLVTGGHEHEITFYDVFTGHPEYVIAVNPHPRGYRPNLVKTTDVLVLYDYADADEAGQKALRTYLESGKGLVVLHHAVCNNQQWPWWYEEVVGGLYVLKAMPGKPASSYKHDQEFDVRPVGSHPVIRGIAPFHIGDEAYGNVWVSPKVQVLLETEHPLNVKPVAWIGPYTKSRVVYIQLGHDHLAHQNPVFRKLVHQAIAWCGATPST